MALPSKIRLELEEAIAEKKGIKRYRGYLRDTINRMITDMNRKERINGVIKPREVMYRTMKDESDKNYFFAYYDSDENIKILTNHERTKIA